MCPVLVLGFQTVGVVDEPAKFHNLDIPTSLQLNLSRYFAISVFPPSPTAKCVDLPSFPQRSTPNRLGSTNTTTKGHITRKVEGPITDRQPLQHSPTIAPCFLRQSFSSFFSSNSLSSIHEVRNHPVRHLRPSPVVESWRSSPTLTHNGGPHLRHRRLPTAVQRLGHYDRRLRSAIRVQIHAPI